MQTVNHKIYGVGEVISKEATGDGSYITVKFESGKEARFSIPNSFTLGIMVAEGSLKDEVEVAIAEKKVSTSLLQRKLSVGYARAAKLIDMMAEMHVVGEYAGSKPREVLWSDSYWAEYKMKALEDAPID